MNFDSKLVIIASPEVMAMSMGRDNQDPMLRRFTDTCGSCHVDTRNKARVKLVDLIFKCVNSINKILPMTDKELDYDIFVNSLPNVVNITYSE